MRHEWDLAPAEPEGAWKARLAAELSAVFAERPAVDLLDYMWSRHGSRLALVSSFGAEAAVLLHMAAQVDVEMPVLFIDTAMLFEETLAYQEALSAHLGLRNLHRIRADAKVMDLADPGDDLHRRAPDDCCYLRKTLPLEIELLRYDAWVTGRKQYQTPQRAGMDLVEIDGSGRFKINPLARWSAPMIRSYMKAHDLPLHPLIRAGYASIGCAPCTSPVAPGEDPRAGRWRGQGKTECGIHFGPGGARRRVD